MLIRLHVVIQTEDQEIEQDVKNKLSLICPQLSFSPSREQPSLANCLEWYATANLNDKEITDLLSKLNNDWDGEKEDCSAYGFNTRMFHDSVYYLQFQIQ